MFNQDEGKIEFAVGNREMGYWQGKKAKIVLILFLTSGFAVFICFWLLVLPNSNNLINHVIKYKYSNFLIFMSELPPHQTPIFPATLKKKNYGKTFYANSQSGNTGFNDITQDGGMENGCAVDNQRIELSMKSIIIATVPHKK